MNEDRLLFVGLAVFVFLMFGFLAWVIANEESNKAECQAMRCPETAHHLWNDGKCLCTTEAQP